MLMLSSPTGSRLRVIKLSGTQAGLLEVVKVGRLYDLPNGKPSVKKSRDLAILSTAAPSIHRMILQRGFRAKLTLIPKDIRRMNANTICIATLTSRLCKNSLASSTPLIVTYRSSPTQPA
jgi:hypothetical protein